MSIELFPHNQEAYEYLLTILETERRACIIHPTGTGKSFIGFKYCEDHPEQSVLWLSPSDYIFKTQCASLRATGAEIPDNVTFMTYSKLSGLAREELTSLQPDALILDEMHRAAAPTWELPVQTLLAHKPEPFVIGLTATHIRYLDGQKDTTAVFHMNIASEMTLGEAIARGILKAPRYVLTSFGLEAELKRYHAKFRRAKSAAVRDEGEMLLEKLRRALEQADGLDVVFRKHMTDTTGKYLVFCANVEHMRTMMSHASEWFSGIDPDAHIYYAYSVDPAASRAFRDFKADKSEHLKLLFTIDMLNEGIHVEDVSGVILFRPTVSPIIYKQQIGRALSASSTKEPIIFDVVNNIENLYSIGAVEQAMRDAMLLLRDRGEGDEVVVDRFDVIDELRDCRELFAKLDETLTTSWELMFAYARRYYQEHGDLLVPNRYRTADGYALGYWLQTQRKVRQGNQYGKLDEHRIALLDSIGMVWEDKRELSWRQYYEALCRYQAQYGDIDIKSNYTDDAGISLGSFIANIRAARRDGRRSSFLTKERIQQLDDLGMIWDRLDYAWEQNYQACAKYYVEHGDLNVPNCYMQDGCRIGTWLRRQRMMRDGRIEGEITPERISRLNDIGMVWTDSYTSRWEYGYEQARQWYAEHGNLNDPTMYVNDKGFPLGRWLKRHIPDADGKTEIKITPEKKAKLDGLGMVWERQEDSWEVRYALVKRYYEEHGSLNIPPQYKADGIWISKWLNEQRQIYIGRRPGKELTKEQIERLEAIGMTWENKKQVSSSQAWQEQFAEAKQYYQDHGNLKIPDSYRTKTGKNLNTWISRQRKLKKEGKLSEQQIELLTGIGMKWEFEDSWENGFTHAEQYFRKHGNLNAGNGYVCEDGYRLGNWLSNQRNNHNHPSDYHKLSKDQTNRLEQIGIVWRTSDEKWLDGYDHAKAYLSGLKGKAWAQSYVSPDGHKTGEWIRGQLRVLRRGGGNEWRRKKLTELGLNVKSGERSLYSDQMKTSKMNIAAT